ncbi:hypothetical protein EI94DRAFT_1810533 [Lactarius quietus]|nr:hypothetical protein EI94DRAFT_1810533 [Lactarius quietus]
MPPHDGVLAPQSSPDPKLEDNGSYKCDMCHQKVCVGCGGAKNFKQHWGSPACLKAQRRHESQVNQVGNTKTLLSFFSKVPYSPRTGVVSTGSSTKSSTHANILNIDRSSTAHTTSTPPESPPPSPTPLHQSSESKSVEAEKYRHPDAYTLTLLARLDLAAQGLPMDVSEAEAHDEIACVLSVEDPDNSSKAWEYLDPALNRLLGYGSTVEDVAQCVRCRPLGVEGLGHLICRSVVKHGITGGLLKGKIRILLSAIKMLKKQTTTCAPHDCSLQQVLTASTTTQTLHASPPQLEVSDDSDIEYVTMVPSNATQRLAPASLSQSPNRSTPTDNTIV